MTDQALSENNMEIRTGLLIYYYDSLGGPETALRRECK